MAKGSTRTTRLKAVGVALKGDAIGRERARLMQTLPAGTAWQSYPARVGRWTRVCTDKYTGFGKTVIAFVWFFELLGAMLNLSGDGKVEGPGYFNTKPKHWRLKQKVWQVDARFVQILDPRTQQPLGEHELYIPYTAVPTQGVNTDPAQGIVTLQYLGDPRRTGLLLPYGLTPEQSIPAVAIVPGKGGGLDTLAVGPWYLDSPQPPR
jgi:hypothetical protein